MLGLELWETWLNAFKICLRGQGQQVREKENIHWQPLNLKLLFETVSGGKGGWTLALCLKKSKKKCSLVTPLIVRSPPQRCLCALWSFTRVGRLESPHHGEEQRSAEERGTDTWSTGVGATRKEPGNKEGKQKSRALTVTWTQAGKSYIILLKTRHPKKPLFESWNDLCLYLLWKSFSNRLRSWDHDIITVNSTAN